MFIKVPPEYRCDKQDRFNESEEYGGQPECDPTSFQKPALVADGIGGTVSHRNSRE